MSDIAEIVSAPSGTQRRTDDQSQWVTASLGDKLQFGCQTRNTESNEYEVKLYSGACMDFGEAEEVEVSDIIGAALYMDGDGDWVAIEDEGTFSAQAVGTGPGGVVMVRCSIVGGYPPPPWPPRK